MQGNYNWIDHLDEYLSFYNNRVHRTIGMKPIDVSKSDEKFLLESVYRNEAPLVNKTKFTLGSYVRVSRYRNVFDKSYYPNFGTEIFKIVKIDRRHPEVYYLQDYLGNNIKGMFYREELTSVRDPKGYLVERVLKRKGNKLYVKFLGFDNDHNEWVDKNSLI